MYLWRRTAGRKWWNIKEGELATFLGNRLAVIEQPNRRGLQLEAACKSKKEATQLVRQFGGRVEKLSRDWLKRFSSTAKRGSLKVGRRLIIVRSPSGREAGRSPYILIIPAGAAFGTGEHATTALSLRMLERLTRTWQPGWSLVDLGTGSGILALAARLFGAKSVIGIDHDPTAISVAKENARLNKINGVKFQITDVQQWKLPSQINIVTANLFSELLITILPKLKRAPWFIFSGILRGQEREMTGALNRNRIDVVDVSRRGKWVAILAQKRV